MSPQSIASFIIYTDRNETIVLNELLSYYHHYVKCTASDVLKIAIAEFYNPEEIVFSKACMWNAYAGLENEAFDYVEAFKAAKLVQVRKGSAQKPAHVMALEDIVIMSDIADQNPPKMSMLFVAKNHDRIPRCVPSHIEMTSMVRRLRELEVKLTETALQVNTNTNECTLLSNMSRQCNDRIGQNSVQIDEIITAFRGQPPPQPMRGQPPPQSMPYSNATAPPQPMPYSNATARPVGHVPPGGKVPRDPRTAKPRQSDSRTGAQRQSHVPGRAADVHAEMSGTPSVSNDADSFQYPKRKGYRKKAEFGSNTGSGTLVGVKKTTEVFIFNMRTDISVSDVTDYVSSVSGESGGVIDVIECRKVSKDDSRSNSFVIKVLDDDAQRMFNSDFWPERVGFRKFWPKRIEGRQRDDS